jgi:hypothetical protein
MNISGDSVKELCWKMDTKSLHNFILTSQQNYDLCVKIYNYKYYLQNQYPILNDFYTKKLNILDLLDKRTKVEGHVSVLSGGNPYKISQVPVDRFLYFRFTYYPQYDLYVFDPDFQFIMMTEDPNIKLDTLYQSIYQ